MYLYCIICSKVIREDDAVALPCEHIFDSLCAQNWVYQWSNCADCHDFCHPSQLLSLMNTYSSSAAVRADVSLNATKLEIEKQKIEINEWKAKLTKEEKSLKLLSQNSEDNNIRLNTEINRLRELVTEYLNEIKRNEAEITNTRNQFNIQIVDLNYTSASKAKECDLLNGKVNDLTKKCNELETENDGLNAKISLKRNECSNLKSNISQLKSRINDLSKQLSLKQNECSYLSSDVSQLNHRITELQKELHLRNAKSSELNGLKLKGNQLSGKITEQSKKIDSLTKSKSNAASCSSSRRNSTSHMMSSIMSKVSDHSTMFKTKPIVASTNAYNSPRTKSILPSDSADLFKSYVTSPSSQCQSQSLWQRSSQCQPPPPLDSVALRRRSISWASAESSISSSKTTNGSVIFDSVGKQLLYSREYFEYLK